jgi:hypothetical protein
MRWQQTQSPVLIAISTFALFASAAIEMRLDPMPRAAAQTAATPTPAPVFDQTAAVAKLKEQIKGKEKELAPAVFKNVQTMKNTTAERFLAVMEFGFARSLGVNCTHCHIPDKWEAEDKPQKQIAREMSAMVATINKELLRNIKNLKSETPIVNCTTCHRGDVKPALNLPQPAGD